MDERPVLDYGRPERRNGTNVPLPIALAIIAVATVLLWVVIGPGGHSHSREKANQIKCASNLRQIGQSMQLYAQDNGGLFPPNLQTLAGTQPIGLDAMVCPSSPDTKPPNTASIGSPSGCSYIYVGADLTSKADPDCILALEDPDNHGLTGGNVLFADGHVEFLDLPAIQLILLQLNAGRNPPASLTPTLSQAAAEQDYQTNWKSRMPQLKSGVWRIPTTQPSTTPQ